jgi:predicted nucleic acid-binding protein
MAFPDIRETLDTVREICTVVPLTVETHVLGLQIAERHGLAIYDALIVGAALLAGCTVLWSEDMQHGLVVDQRLVIRNPFR